jgi:hypothetical protein
MTAFKGLSFWADFGPPEPEPEPEPHEKQTTFGFWTPNGFWQFIPSTFPDYEPPELTDDEMIAAAFRYAKKMYGGETSI